MSKPTPVKSVLMIVLVAGMLMSCWARAGEETAGETRFHAQYLPVAFTLRMPGTR